MAVLLVVTGGCAYGSADDGSGGSSQSGGALGKADLIATPYRAPWSCGDRYYVSQGNDGDLCSADNGDHIQIQNYAWDFALPRHTQVRAARSGMVTLATNTVHEGESCYDGCPFDFTSTNFADCCKRCLLLSNRVNVQHDDGTVATYWHLDQATVQAGQQVEAGGLLGYSGTSGCSTGPHLHFQVMGSCPTGYCQSKSIQFAEAGVPKCGDRVESANLCN
jgi:murein DD-endopeptidase MepM/ murein hydrolase activator NlpD